MHVFISYRHRSGKEAARKVRAQLEAWRLNLRTVEWSGLQNRMKDEYRRCDAIGIPGSRTRWTMRRLALAAIGETTFL